MGAWKAQKDKFLAMDINTKRRYYNNYTTLEKIPTWKEYASQKSLPSKMGVRIGNQIDNLKNAILVEKISIFLGDITTLEVDAIVNSAHSSLMGGGGVDDAIHRAAGPCLAQECQALGSCSSGEARITGGYHLPAKYVIHTAGPQSENQTFLENCYHNSLQIMLTKSLKTIAFPCIFTGAYQYPNELAAHVGIYTVRKFLEHNADRIDKVIFCLFLDVDLNIYEALLQSYFPLK